MPKGIRNATLGCLLAGGLAVAWAQTGIYSCTDGKGRRLTADRPIAECADREQRILTSVGAVRTLGPTLSPNEQAAKLERDKREAEDKQRQAEQRRIDRLLVARYPNQAAHEAERAKALAAVRPPSHEAEEKQRVNERFDQELAKLRVLWAQTQGVAAAATEPAPIRR